MSQRQAMDAIQQSRERILQTLDLFSPDQLEKEHLVDKWSIKDVISHLIAWDDALLSVVTQLPGKVFELDNACLDHNSYNAHAVEKRRELPFSMVLEELKDVRQTLIDAVVTLDADQKEKPVQYPWGGSGTVIEGVAGLAWHEEEHSKELLQLYSLTADE